MSSYQLIITIRTSHKSESFIWRRAVTYSSHFNQEKFKTITGDLTSTILKSHSLELVTIVILINFVIDRFSGEDIRWLAHVIVLLQVSDYSQLSVQLHCPITTRLIRTKYNSLWTNHIWGNCNYDYSLNCTPLGPVTITYY